ncbi:energy transducer TonB [Herbaspirillum seropedicae]|uniref:energy transducer TonB n=1 Tax=Herbaspirillum seropedicae TaxID=964 RepID=UPI003D97138A
MKIAKIAQAGILAILTHLLLTPSLAQDASGTVLVPPAISYPADARRMDEEGNVTLRFVVDKSGQISSIEVIKSSGYARLDRAVEGVQASRFGPFMRQGQPVEMTFTREIKFQLETADSQDRRPVSNISFAADLDAHVAVARSAILKFSVMPSTAAKLNPACFDGIGQSTDKNPDVLTQAIQDPAAMDQERRGQVTASGKPCRPYQCLCDGHGA